MTDRWFWASVFIIWRCALVVGVLMLAATLDGWRQLAAAWASGALAMDTAWIFNVARQRDVPVASIAHAQKRRMSFASKPRNVPR